MSSALFRKFFNLPFDLKEIARYAGAPSIDELAVFNECKNECESQLSLNVAYRISEVTVGDDEVSFEFGTLKSRDLCKNLNGVKKVLVFAASIGQPFDFLIGKYKRISPAKSLVFQAIGTERIETLCDAICETIQEEYKVKLRPRFSPGYGDLSLDCQADILNYVEARRIGVTLNESLLMSPSKSVTAIAGFSDVAVGERHNCDRCGNLDCEFRKV